MKKMRSILFILFCILIGCAPESLKMSSGAGAKPQPTPGPGVINTDLDIKVLYNKLKLPTVDLVGDASSIFAFDQGAALEKFSVFPYAGLAQHGNELWITDGTVSGTKLLKDILPGNRSSNPSTFYAHNKMVYFTADDGVHGSELWQTDGTIAGTIIVADINPGPNGSYISQLTSMGNELFFIADNGSSGSELYKIGVDGVEMVKDINPSGSSSILYLTAVKAPNGSYALYFSANDGSSGSEPWKSLGTTGSTVRISDISSGSGSSSPNGFAILGENVFFSAYRPESGYELYKTNVYTTTIDGNKEFYDIYAGTGYGGAYSLLAFDGKIYFRASGYTAAGGATGVELWESDGTLVGTKMVVDAGPGNLSSSCSPLKVVGNVLYLTCSLDGLGGELYRLTSDKTNVEIVKDIYVGSQSSNLTPMGILNGKFVFRGTNAENGLEAWVSDGTPAGTMLLRDYLPGTKSSIPLSLIPVPGKKALSRVYSGGIASKLFITDGTPEGTQDFSFINRRVLDKGAMLGETLFFGAETVRDGVALWRTDGTTAGTRVVHELKSTVTDSVMFSSYKNSSNSFYFGINDPAEGSSSIWKSDGSTAGTVQSANSILSHLYLLNPERKGDVLGIDDFFYFMSGGADIDNRRLYSTEGDRASSKLVAGTIVFAPSHLTHFNSAVYLSGKSSVDGRELFKIADGSNNISLVADLNAGTGSSDPVGLQTNNNKLYFLAKVSGLNALHLQVVDSDDVVTDLKSMAAGAVLLRDKMYSLNGNICYSLQRGDGLIEVWETDGTTDGTKLIPFAYGTPNDVAAVSDTFFLNGKLMFMAAHKSGKSSLYATNSENEFESLSTFDKNLMVDLDSARVIENRLFYAANDNKIGFELYWHDGETSATIDILEGAAGSYPSVIAKNKKYLFVAADVGEGTTLLTIPWDDL